jgi:hypothetical protein
VAGGGEGLGRAVFPSPALLPPGSLRAARACNLNISTSWVQVWQDLNIRGRKAERQHLPGERPSSRRELEPPVVPAEPWLAPASAL